MTVSQFDPLYQDAAGQYNLDPLFLRAQDIVESNERPNAVSSAGAQGIAQFMPGTAATAGPNGTPIDPTNPVQAIPAQARMMDGLITKYTDPNTGEPDVNTALMEYHGGPDRSIWGPQTAAYPRKVATAYALLKSNTASDASAKSSSSSSPDLFDQMMQGPDPKPAAPTVAPTVAPTGAPTVAPTGTPTAAPTAATAPDLFDQMMTGPDPQPPGGEPPGTTPAGLAKNAAAGVADVGANIVNTVSDPFGNLLGKPLATAITFAHDALAPVFGYQRFPDQVRNALLGDTAPQPGTALVNAASNQLTGGTPDDVPANSPAERLTRKIIGTAGTAAILGAPSPTVVGPAVAGTVAGDQLAQGAPAWAQPAIETAGNVGGAILAGNAAMRGDAVAAKAKAEADVAKSIAKTPLVNQDITSANVDESGVQLSPSDKSRQVATDRYEDTPRGPVDSRRYVPGDTAPLEAEVNPTPQNVAEYKVAEKTSPQTIDNLQGKLNDQRVDAFHELTDDSQLNQMQAQADAATKPALNAVFANKTAVTSKPVLDYIDQTLSPTQAPDAVPGTAYGLTNRPAVARVLNQVRDTLTDSEGNPLTDPEALYNGARQNITDLLEKGPGDPDYAAVQASRHFLTNIKSRIDDVIEEGSSNPRVEAEPGDAELYSGEAHDAAFGREAADNLANPTGSFKDYLADYHDAMQPVNEIKALQPYLSGSKAVIDNHGVMQFNKFQRMMENLVDDQDDPTSHASSISQPTMQKLWNLRDDLARKDHLAKAKANPNIVQDLTAQLKKHPNLATSWGLQLANEAIPSSIGAVIGGPVGTAVGAGVGMVANRLTNRALTGLSNRASQARIDALADRVVNGPSATPPPRRSIWRDTSGSVPLNSPIIPGGRFGAAEPPANNFGPRFVGAPAQSYSAANSDQMIVNRLTGGTSNPTALPDPHYIWRGDLQTGADPNAPTTFGNRPPVLPDRSYNPLNADPTLGARMAGGTSNPVPLNPPTAYYTGGRIAADPATMERVKQYATADAYAKGENPYSAGRRETAQQQQVREAEAQRLRDQWTQYQTFSLKPGFGRKYAAGGLVPGAGTADNAIIQATPGEFVLRREAVKALGTKPVATLNRLHEMPALKSKVRNLLMAA